MDRIDRTDMANNIDSIFRGGKIAVTAKDVNFIH